MSGEKVNISYQPQSMLFRVIWADKNNKDEKFWEIEHNLRNLGCTVVRVKRVHEPEECCEETRTNKKDS